MNVQEIVLDILEGISGTNFKNDLDAELFVSGLVDSLGTVELLLELEEKFAIDVPISEFDRTKWDTPTKIIASVEQLQ